MGWLLIRIDIILFILFIQVALIAVHKLVHTSGSINQFHLTCIEGVRSAGDFQFDQWVINSIFQFHSLF